MSTVAALSDNSAEPADVEFLQFFGLVSDATVAVQEEELYDVEKYPASVSLLACANKHGYYAAATTQGFIFGTTKSLRETFKSATIRQTVPISDDKITVQVDTSVLQVRFSADESYLLIATQGGKILVYAVNDLRSKKSSVTPIQSISLNNEIMDLKPNPEAIPNLTAVLFNNHRCKIIDFMSGKEECDFGIDNATAICWSPKGKQIVCGKLDGSLQHFDSKGVSKSSLPIAESMSAGHGDEKENRSVQDVLWIENHVFLVLYARPRSNAEDDYINDGFIIDRKPKDGSNTPLYTRLSEITPIFDTDGRGNKFYMELIRDFGKEIKHLIIVANAATSELSVVGQSEEGEWATWMLGNNVLPSLPLSLETDLDTYPVGLALDLTADEKLPPVDTSENETGVEPMPILYLINEEGRIGAFHCYNSEMAKRGEAFTTTLTTTTSTTTTASSSTPSTASLFGATSSNSGSFGDLLAGKATSPTAPSGFGSFGTAPATGFSSFSALGSASNISPPPSTGFGAAKAPSDSVVPQFGSTTSFGSTSSFGLNTAQKPLFASPVKTDQTVPSASTSKPSAFGSSSFGASTNTSAFGSTSSFGASTKPSATGFGAPANPPAFGSSSGFGALAKNTVPGAVTPTSGFGSTSTLGGGFGALSKNTVPGAVTPSSGFGSTSTLGGGFGVLSKNTVPGAKAPTTSAFGSTSSFGTADRFASATNTAIAAPATPSSGSGTTSKPAAPKETPTKTEPVAPIPTSFTSSATKTTAPLANTPKPTSTPTTPSASAATNIISPSITSAKPASAPLDVPKAEPSTTSAPKAEASPIQKPSPETATSKPETTTSKPVTKPNEKPKPTAEPGMAREFESLYISVCHAIEELSEIHNRIYSTMGANASSTGNKTEKDLIDTSCSWNLNDVANYGALADKITKEITQDEETTIHMLKQLDSLNKQIQLSMDKKEDIGFLLKKEREIDPEVVELMDKRELDVETKEELKEIQMKTSAYGSMLENLEMKLTEYTKLNKAKHDRHSGELTLYSLYRAIRDIEKDVSVKKNDLEELEVRLANIKLKESTRRARQSSAGFSCVDLSDEEEEEEPPVSQSIIQHTTRYLRRFNFLNEMCELANNRAPFETSSH